MRYYIAIPDIHGMRGKLDKALADIDNWIESKRNDGTIKLEDKIQFIFLGDYIDRGPDSKYVLAKVKEYVLERGAICLLGNHDLFLTGTAEATSVYFESSGKTFYNIDVWENNGGLKTCKEMFGSKLDQHFLESNKLSDYIDDIKNSEEYQFLKTHAKRKHETELIFFSHAPQSDPKNYDDTILVWGRSRDYDKPDSNFKVPGLKAMSVHGHYHKAYDGIYFPRIINYVHGGRAKTVVLADSGCGCNGYGELHPVIIAESPIEENGASDYVTVLAIL